MTKRAPEEMLADEYVRIIAELAADRDVAVYLAGGGLRDLFLGRQVKDLDFALAGMPEAFPRLFAERIGGSFFWLDRERAQSRVTKRTGEGGVSFDFAPLRGEGIEDDLRLRDFTVNAMALKLAAEPCFVDPLNGESDLEKQLIRNCSETSLEDDPLRLLRGIRLAVTLGFSIEAGTFDAIRKKAPLLEKVAAERTRDEFLQILEAPAVAASLQMLDDAGLLAVVIPGARQEKIAESAVAGGIAAAVRIEGLVEELAHQIPDCAERMATHLGREVEGGVTARSLLKLAALAGGAQGMGTAGAWSARLRLGRRAARMLAILGSDPAAVFSALAARPTRRAMFHFCRDHEPAGLELALLALARAEAPQWLCSELVRYRFQDYDPTEAEFLLSGEEVMGIIGSGPGQAVGDALALLREAESRGGVNSREEAREFLQKNLLTKREPMR